MFRLVAILCVCFVALTTLAMFLYPGGTAFDHDRCGYSFCSNFLSDLGRTCTHGGRPNSLCMTLFIVALSSQAIALVLFVAGFMRFFHDKPLARRLGQAAFVLAVTSAGCFVGVAVTPWNLVLAWHIGFVVPAFGLLLGAVLLTMLAIRIEGGFPAGFNRVFGVFALLLCAYVALLVLGPSLWTPRGLLVQATSQKVTVYATEVAFMILSLKAQRFSQIGASR